MNVNCYEIQDTHTYPLKGVLKYLNERYFPLVGLLVELNVSLSSSNRKDLIYSKHCGFWEISMPR
jgi:hypothetical protein